jgi:acyl carrier protein
MKEIIINIIKEVANNYGWEITNDIKEETKLIDCGLDSLGIAILVSKLEEVLKKDPFSKNENFEYPENIGEFIKLYE